MLEGGAVLDLQSRLGQYGLKTFSEPITRDIYGATWPEVYSAVIPRYSGGKGTENRPDRPIFDLRPGGLRPVSPSYDLGTDSVEQSVSPDS